MPRQKKAANKSQAVRDLLAENPKLKAKEVVEQLAAKGISITASQVYFVKGGMSQKKQTAAKKAKKVAKKEKRVGQASAMHADPIAVILEIKALAKKLGGMANLKQLVEVLGE